MSRRPTSKVYGALIFDLMGTCTNWSVSIIAALRRQCANAPSALPNLQAEDDLKSFASDWRTGFFREIHRRFEDGEAQEDIDVTHRRVLDQLLARPDTLVPLNTWGDAVRTELVESWHHQEAWPDAIEGLQRLGEQFFVVVLANGTTRLQLDLMRSSGLTFHALFSSQLLGLTKPDPKIYQKVLELLQLDPEDCIMVAAHAYDLRAAATVGLRTAYVHRATEDLHEDMALVRRENSIFVSGTDGGRDSGLNALADILCPRIQVDTV
ncbi:hypothetical protein D9757_000933 [Collybiopsis confluens]|uniref:Haloacid dehalogenase n=1 Tax=Collybiopsis confluens TaxID=2823264 RepID=A0A8H5I0A8_9AGAR|nr:hypothetical protein D9757_000933 [Collybiopsis confluens]